MAIKSISVCMNVWIAITEQVLWWQEWQNNTKYKKLSYCWETVRRESMPRIAEMDVEMTT